MASQLLRAALILPALLVLALILGGIIAGRLRHLRTHSLSERAFLWTAVGVVTISWVGVLAATLDLFHKPVVALSLSVIAFIAWFRRRQNRRSADSSGAHTPNTPSPVKLIVPTPLPVRILIVTFLCAAAVLYARPAESFFLVDDSAVYTIGGVLLARTGSLVARPEVFWKTTEDFVHQFMAIDPFLMTSRHFGPFYQWTANQTSIEVGFLPLPKVWIALAAWLSGPGYATWATPLFGVLGLAALYVLIRRLLSWQAGVASIVLLGLSLPQVWFARYPLSEVYTQFFLLTGLYLAVLARQNAMDFHLSRQLALWSALSLAALTVVRFEAALFLVVITAFLLVGWRRVTPNLTAFVRPWLLTLAVTTLYGLFISIGLARHYFLAQSLTTLGPDQVRIGLIALIFLGGICVIIWQRRAMLGRAAVYFSAWPVWTNIGLWAACTILIIWQLLTRDWGKTLSGWLAQYWTLPGMISGGMGLGWLLYRGESAQRRGRESLHPELMALVGLGLMLAIGYSLNPAVNPVHPWAVRRLVPVVLPLLALGAGGLFAWGFEFSKRLADETVFMRLRQWILVAGVVALFLWQSYAIAKMSWPLWTHQEMKGFYQQIRSIADQLPPDAMLLFDNGQTGERMTQVFEFVFERPSLSIRSTPASTTASEIDRLIEAAHSRGQRILFVVTDGTLQWWPERWKLVSQGASKIETALLRPVQGRPPNASDIINRTLWLDVYEILPAVEDMPAPDLPITVPIGAGSYPYFRAGFENWTLTATGEPIRWTTGDGHVLLPWPENADGYLSDSCLILQVAGGRPIEDERALLDISMENQQIFSGVLPPGFEVQTLQIPVHKVRNNNDPGLEIALHSNTWNPDGNRVLGVLMHSMTLTTAAACLP